MRCPPTAPDEPQRLKALAQYEVSSTQTLPILDPIVQIAARVFDVPMSAVNMIGRNEVFFAARHGIGEMDMGRDVSFCAHAITQADVLVIEDARLDERFHDNPLVTRPGGIRFYAGVPVRHPDGQALGALCIIDTNPRFSFSSDDRAQLKEMAKLVTDQLELRRLEVAGQAGISSFERVAIQTPNGIICFDERGMIRSLNPAAEKLFAWTADDAIGKSVDLIFPEWQQSDLVPLFRQTGGARTDHVQEDLAAVRRDGTTFTVEVAWSAWLEGEESNFGVVVRDLTHQRRRDDRLYRLANFDLASGLPNRNMLQEKVAEIASSHGRAALLAIGVRGIDDLAATLGPVAGSAVFTEVADRIRACVRPMDMLARIGRDDFVLFLPDVADPLRGTEIATTVLAATASPIAIDGREVRFDASCGIVLLPAQADEPDELIGSAGLALEEARKLGPGKSFLFVPALRMEAVARRMFEAELHRAVEREEFELYYQPQVRIADCAFVGAEALIRWNHPERGLLAPAAFLTALEESPLAPAVGAWVINQACGQAAEWRRNLSTQFRMSLNLFAAQLRTGDLYDRLKASMQRFNLAGDAVELEITETTALNDEGLFLPLFRQLREDGIKLAFDDFGTGFASLGLLNRYPLTHLKIDKLFIQEAFVSDRSRLIVKAITSLAHELQLCVIAEGVETESQFDFCRNIGCDEVQGYWTGRPVCAGEFEKMWRPTMTAGPRLN